MRGFTVLKIRILLIQAVQRVVGDRYLRPLMETMQMGHFKPRDDV